MNGRERALTMLRGGEVDRPPVMPITMMFAADQAGSRYGDYANDFRVLVRAQVFTATKFDFDYVSVISDPAREAADCGAVVRYFEDQPPAIDEARALLTDKTVLRELQVPEPASGKRMSDRVHGVEALKKEIGADKLVEGWVEGPCAEGADLRGINNLMLDFYDDPAFVRDLFDFIVEMELAFARAQIEAGADLIGVGDAAASLVGPAIYQEFVWPYEQRLIKGLQSMGALVRLHICGNTNSLLEEMGRLGSDMIDLDFMVSLTDGRRLMGPDQVLSGNMDPVRILRDASAEAIRAEIRKSCEQIGPRYIIGPGCEIARSTPDENVFALHP
jgi:MtaA/CmuA family methyltransferase